MLTKKEKDKIVEVTGVVMSHVLIVGGLSMLVVLSIAWSLKWLYEAII